MTNTTNATKKFYDSTYWQSGAGELLWNARKIQAFILAISTPSTPLPFFTAIPYSDIGDKWEGWIAEWNFGEKERTSLVIEAEGKEFCVYASHFIPDDDGSHKYVTDFWYNFGSSETDEDNSSWDLFDDAVKDAKEWLETNKLALVAETRTGNPLHRLFNIE